MKRMTDKRGVARGRQGGAADWFLIGMIGAVVLASIAPDLGRTGGLLHLDVVGNVGIFLIFFLHGMGLSTESLKHGASRWKLHLVVQISTFALFPLWWLLLNALVGRFIPHDLLLGFFYLAVLPSTVSSSVAMTAMARGNVAAAVLNATLSTLLGVVLTPLLASLVFSGAADGQAAQGIGHGEDGDTGTGQQQWIDRFEEAGGRRLRLGHRDLHRLGQRGRGQRGGFGHRCGLGCRISHAGGSARCDL